MLPGDLHVVSNSCPSLLQPCSPDLPSPRASPGLCAGVIRCTALRRRRSFAQAFFRGLSRVNFADVFIMLGSLMGISTLRGISDMLGVHKFFDMFNYAGEMSVIKLMQM